MISDNSLPSHIRTYIERLTQWVPGSALDQALGVCASFNSASPDESDRLSVLHKHLIFRNPVFIEPAFYCLPGGKTVLGKTAFLNHNVTIIDIAAVNIGAGTFIGPNVTITTLDTRSSDAATAPVTIGKGVWIGANATILPGAVIGDFAIIGAGVTVSSHIASNTTYTG